MFSKTEIILGSLAGVGLSLYKHYEIFSDWLDPIGEKISQALVYTGLDSTYNDVLGFLEYWISFIIIYSLYALELSMLVTLAFPIFLLGYLIVLFVTTVYKLFNKGFFSAVFNIITGIIFYVAGTGIFAHYAIMPLIDKYA